LRGKHFDGKQKYDEEEIIFNKSWDSNSCIWT
jgi:hypothetical protein